MITIPVRIKLKPGAIAPKYQTDGSSGMDLHALNNENIPPRTRRRVATGVHLEIPDGFEAQIRPRSGLSLKGVDIKLGTIDRDFIGEICVVVENTTDGPFEVRKGDRIAQMVFAPVETADLVVVQELSATVRGVGGFGSTGL